MASRMRQLTRSEEPSRPTIFNTLSASLVFNWIGTSPFTLETPDEQTCHGSTATRLGLDTCTSDGSSNTLTYYAVSMPNTLRIASSSAVISGTVANGIAGIGSYHGSPVAGARLIKFPFCRIINYQIAGLLLRIQHYHPADRTNNNGDTVALSISVSNSGSFTLVYTASVLPSVTHSSSPVLVSFPAPSALAFRGCRR